MQNLCGCPDILICRESAVGQIPSSRTTIHSFIIRFLQENVNGIFGKFAFLPILQKAFDGISANPAPFLCDVAIGQYRTKRVWRLCTPSACKFPFRACFVSSRTHLACIFSEIFRENTRKSTKDFLRFPFISQNLTTQSACVRYETDSHISQKMLVNTSSIHSAFVSSDEKFDDASVAQSLCGIAIDFFMV